MIAVLLLCVDDDDADDDAEGDGGGRSHWLKSLIVSLHIVALS